MTYTIRKQDTITRQYGVFWGDSLVEGGLNRDDAEDSLEWFQANHPTGPAAAREILGWWVAP